MRGIGMPISQRSMPRPMGASCFLRCLGDPVRSPFTLENIPPSQKVPNDEKAPGPGARGQVGDWGRQKNGSADVEGDAAIGGLLGTDDIRQLDLLAFELLGQRTIGDHRRLHEAGLL